MNSWQTIKRVLGNDGGKVVIMENDEVKYIVLTLQEYERLSGSSPQQPSLQTESPVTQTQTQAPASEHLGSIRIEDLPL